jgi:ribosome-binding factor A
MIGKTNPHIKRAQKESLLVRELSKLLLYITLDHPELQGLFINRVELSPDRSVCYIYFYAVGGIEDYRKRIATLILYKPSLRKSLATAMPARHTPNLVFKFDEQFEKQQRIEHLLESIKDQTTGKVDEPDADGTDD